MSRLFTGSGGFDEVVVLAPGSVVADTFTWLWYWIPKAGALTTSGGIAQLRASSSAQRSIQHETDPAYYFQGFSPFGDIDVDDPAIIGYGKSSGTNAIRIHWWRESTGTWTHANGESFGNVGTIDEIWLGKAFGRMSGLWIAGAAWDTNLADATIENADLETGLAAWAALTPVALWAGNQAVATDPVTDLTSNGADETAIIGDPPAVSAEEPTGWSYDLDSGTTVELGLASDTDSAHTITRIKTRTLGQPSGTDTAHPLTARKTRTLGLPSDADTALPITRRKVITLGLASDTDSAFALGTTTKRRTLGVALEADTAMSLIGGEEATPGTFSSTATAPGFTATTAAATFTSTSAGGDA